MLVQVMKLVNFSSSKQPKNDKKEAHTSQRFIVNEFHRVRSLDLALDPVKELAQLWNNRSTNTVPRAA